MYAFGCLIIVSMFSPVMDGLTDKILFSMFGPSEDGFADNLTIPDNIVVSEPKKELETEVGTPDDKFQHALLAALKTAGTDDLTITANVTSLVQLQRKAPDILRRYLAASPSWRVFNEKGAMFATRRWMIGSNWLYDLHGYYTKHDIDMWMESGIPDFQSRVTIGLSGKPWWRGDKDTTYMSNGQTKKVILSQGNQMYESHCVITDQSIVLEVFEESEVRERRLTKASLAHINSELEQLVQNPTWEQIQKILPPGSIRHGKPSFDLRNSFQPGIYNSEIWLNPGEVGMIYLKAFEITKGTPLSMHDLKEYSNEWIGWSDNPDQLFFSNTHFTIYEGDWGKPYAARFEVWFVPNSGGPERKTMEKIFKIEGWQR